MEKSEPQPKKRYAYIDNVTKEECFERWEGVMWVPKTTDSPVGLCKSDYDFDAWIEERDKGEDDAGNAR